MSAASTGAAGPGWSPLDRASLPLLAVAGPLFAYVAWRAWRVPITWDEAANYLEYTRKGFLSPFWFPFAHFGANNHFLNSWLTYLTTGMFGPGELSLRLPVLGAHLLFLYYTGRLSRTFGSPLQRVSAFLVLNANPYVLDFFSLARGYGLSYGLLAGALWHLREYLRSGTRPRQGLISLGLAMLAVTAHLTLVHFLIALLAVVVLAPVVTGTATEPVPRRFAAAFGAHRIAIVAVTLFLLPTLLVIRRLARAGAFFYGGRTGFWQDTVLSVMDHSLYGKGYGFSPPVLSQGLGVFALLTVVTALVVSLKAWRRSPDPPGLYLPALLFLLFASAFASIAQHHLLGVLYLTGRTGLYLLVLWTFVLVALLAELIAGHRGWRYGLGGIALVLVLHAATTANGRSVLEWKASADIKQMLRDLAAARGRTPSAKFNTDVGASLDYEAPLNYYRAVSGLTWLNVVDRKTRQHPLNELYLYTPEDWRAADPDSFVVIKVYPRTQGRLLRRRARPPTYLVTLVRTSAGSDRADTAAGSIRFPIPVPTEAARRSVVTVEALVSTERWWGVRAELALRFSRGGSSYAWCGVSLQDFAPGSDGWVPVYLSCFVPAEARVGDAVSLSLDHESTPLRLGRVTLRWLTAED